MAFTAYVLQNPDGRVYIGSTDDVSRRLSEHQTGLAGWTKSRGPWTLVYSEDFATRAEAMHRERQLKGGQGREWLKKMLDGRAGPPEAD
jgi:predicted GIY-YIG superfamily endonuclease